MAVQVYWPPCDVLSGENMYSTELLVITDITVELGDTIFSSGSTTRPSTTLAEHSASTILDAPCKILCKV